MIDIGIVCHSSKMVDEIIKFVEIFKNSDFQIVNLGKSKTLKLGTKVKEIKENIENIDNGNPFLVFVDMGSSVINMSEVREQLKNKIDIEISNAPLLEGLITAITANDDKIDLKTLKEISEESIYLKKDILEKEPNYEK